MIPCQIALVLNRLRLFRTCITPDRVVDSRKECYKGMVQRDNDIDNNDEDDADDEFGHQSRGTNEALRHGIL